MLTRFRALLWIALSTVLVTGGTVGGGKLWSYWKEVRQTHPHYHVKEIYQTGPERLALPTQYLAELLDLSVDQPTNLYALDLGQAREQLLASPWISEAKVKRLAPSTLYIDYAVRDPVATLAPGVGVDLEGRWFPLEPFLRDGGLPRLLVASPEHTYHALHLLHLLAHRLQVRCIDVRQLASPRVGEREFRVELHSGRRIRLPVEGVEQALGNYLALEPYLTQEMEVDLRLIQVGYIN